MIAITVNANSCKDIIRSCDEAIESQELVMDQQDKLLNLREKRINDLEKENKDVRGRQTRAKIENITFTSAFWLLVFLL